MDRDAHIALLAVAVLLVPAVAPALAAVQTVLVGGGTPIGTQTGLYVAPASDTQLDLEDPWVDSNTVRFRNVSFSGADADIQVDQFGDPGAGGTWTNISQIDTASGRVTINRSDGRPIGTTGTTDGLRVRKSDLAEASDSVDVVATASGDWTLYVNDTGLAAGKGLVVKNANTGEALDSAAVGQQGNVVFDELTAVTDAHLNIRRGPAELFVFNEEQPNSLVDGAKLRVRVFGTDKVFQREVTDGTMDLTGIPADERLTITVSEQEHFSYRRITIPSATEQAEVYLLNTTDNPDATGIQFQIEDKTAGEFPPGSTRFLVEKPITKDFDEDGTNETKYQVISGDTVGSSREFPATLARDERYRLRVQNDQGDTRLLGSYVVRGQATPTITIGRVTVGSGEGFGYAADLQQFYNDTDGDGYEEEFVRIVYEDEDARTEQLRYEVVDQSDGTVVLSDTIGGPIGTHTQVTQVAENKTSSTYELDWEASRQTDNGTTETISGERFAGDIPAIADQLPIDAKWLSLLGYISIVAIAGLIVIVDSALAGLVATGWASVITVLGFVAIPLPALGLAGVVSVLAVVGRET